MSYEPGAVLCGYKLIRQLGEGGMGSVWEAEHGHLDRKVAIKIVSSTTEKPEESRKRFFQEARASAKIEHPNVVRVLDFEVTDGGEPILVMELLRGETLEERILRLGPLSLVEARSLMVQGAAALAAAHKAGVLHRDIKAENLFLVEGDELTLKLIDFGIARQKNTAHRITGPLEIFGTPQYMSPEQMVSCDEVDERSDLYSFAVCLYYAVTGVLPFSGDSFPAVCLAVTRGDMEPATSVRRGLPEALDEFFAKALAREKKDRFPTAGAMRDAFIAASSAERDTLGAVARLEGPRSRPRRGWQVAAVLVLLVSAGGAVFARSSGAFDRMAAASSPPLEAPVAAASAVAEQTTTLDQQITLDASAPRDALTLDAGAPLAVTSATPKPVVVAPKPAVVPPPVASPRVKKPVVAPAATHDGGVVEGTTVTGPVDTAPVEPALTTTSDEPSTPPVTAP